MTEKPTPEDSTDPHKTNPPVRIEGRSSQSSEDKSADSSDMAQLLSVQREAFTGPLPPPALLRGYEDVLPGAADRIIRMAEQQAQHRQHLERIVVEGGSRRANTGMWLGFIIAILFLGVSAGLIAADRQVAGVILGSVDLTAPVGVFVFGRIDQRRERVEKAVEGDQE